MILLEKGSWWVYDLQSSNGTLLNGSETEAGTLGDGDTITIGASTITFHMEGECPGGQRTEREGDAR